MRFLLGTVLYLSLGSALGAQTVVTVRGVAFDSIRGVPLVEAFVALDGDRSTITDARGRFRFDSVAPGRYTLTLQHAALDAVGIFGLSAPAVVTESAAEFTLASPSFATLWRGVCGTATPPNDSGFVYGSVADARGATVANATVDLNWLQLGVVGRRKLQQREWRGTTRSNATGGYRVCGVPTDVALRIQAITDSASSGVIDLPPDHPRVLRRDLRVSPLTGVAGTARGEISGVVTDSAGVPVLGARVATNEATEEARTDSAGRFTIRGVPTGTRQVEVLAIGMSPVTAVVDVADGESASVLVRMHRLTTLEVVRVIGSPTVRRRVERLEERRRLGGGYFRDSTEIGSHGTMARVLGDFPGTYVEPARGTTANRFVLSMRSLTGGRCVPAIWIDDAPTDSEHLGMLRPGEVAFVEVYPRAFGVPVEFTRANADARTCGAIAVWTRFYFR
ncbi:hypothetical protein J421_1751 [Gemmatirosa kalamazoonensis]|uniref:Carboxypeptidase regulatory-like domain-containing protein n=1 Tax=Gemmatirosa kalamazoonensis TaxID=861299 RepID=W0RIR3_9BACT|nr:carboxypeptidase regulatory-like domain-containing protein [Gemmatirosa kalamazoonensis]AHG89288.1 hypothetical protein J421_1751 [Gemmatirosa kalamazoonensis]